MVKPMTEKEAKALWAAHLKSIREATVVVKETINEKYKRIKRLLNNYEEFCKYYFPNYCKSPNGWFHNRFAKKVAKTPNIRAALEMSRDHAKSTHAGMMLPLWLKAKGEPIVMLLVSYNEDNAEKLLAPIKAQLEANQRYINDFGEQKTAIWSGTYFVTKDKCMFLALGKGQNPRGVRLEDVRPTYILCDDFDDDESVLNPNRLEKQYEWVTGALFATQSIKGGRFIITGNRIHQNSILAQVVTLIKRLIKKQKVRGSEVTGYHLKVNALKANGEPEWPERFTKEDIQSLIDFLPYAIAQREYFNNPITQGKIFKTEWIQYREPLSLKNYDALVAYCDPSFKAKTTSDFKAIRLWGKKGNRYDLIRPFVRQCSIQVMVSWWFDLYEWLRDNGGQNCIHYMEKQFIEQTFLDAFDDESKKRGFVFAPLKDERTKPNKAQRIEAISFLWEKGYIYYNINLKDNADMIRGIEQTLAFAPKSRAHDDAPDADEGALFKLQGIGRAQKIGMAMGKRTHRNSW